MKKDPNSRYEHIIGRISVLWNTVERYMAKMLFRYLMEEVEVFDRLLAAIGNVSQGDLLTFLCERREVRPGMKAQVAHFVKSFNILRENRNILQHALPKYRRDETYSEVIWKVSRYGEYQEFSVKIDDLLQCELDLDRLAHFGNILCAGVSSSANPKHVWEEAGDAMSTHDSFREMIASLDRPPLPRKLSPRQPQSNQQDD